MVENNQSSNDKSLWIDIGVEGEKTGRAFTKMVCDDGKRMIEMGAQDQVLGFSFRKWSSSAGMFSPYQPPYFTPHRLTFAFVIPIPSSYDCSLFSSSHNSSVGFVLYSSASHTHPICRSFTLRHYPPLLSLENFCFVIDCSTDTYTTLNTLESIDVAFATVRNIRDIESDSTYVFVDILPLACCILR